MNPITTAKRARVAWSVIAEIGDEIAHRLVDFFGPERALELVWSDVRATAPDVLAAAVARILPGILWEPSTPVTEEELTAALRRWIPRMSRSIIDEELLVTAKSDVTLVAPEDPEWPSRLNDMGDKAPLILWVRGDAQLLQQDQVALVGARASTAYGDNIARELAEDLGRSGLIITTGGAYGIDAASLRGALASGFKTIAVLAGGLQRVYPIGHDSLLARVAQEGAVISAVPFTASPTKHRFLSRNGVISALSQGVVVVEAGSRSGSLSTVSHALAQGRPVGAVPGPVTSAASGGTNLIIQDGRAKLVTSAADVEQLIATA